MCPPFDKDKDKEVRPVFLGDPEVFSMWVTPDFLLLAGVPPDIWLGGCDANI